MPMLTEIRTLSEQFLSRFLETARTLQSGPDAEVTLEALIDAARMLEERLRCELDELRVEQAE